MRRDGSGGGGGGGGASIAARVEWDQECNGKKMDEEGRKKSMTGEGVWSALFPRQDGLTCSIVDDITRHCWLDGGNRKIRHTHIMAAVHEHGPGTGTGTGWLSGTGNAAPFFLLSSPRLLPYSSGVHEAL